MSTIESINGMGYVQARKEFGAFVLYFRGTCNEIFPGESFITASQARHYAAAYIVKNGRLPQ